MEFKFTEPTGNVINVPLERWIWGVVYKPTPEQIKAAEEATQLRKKDFTAELQIKETELRRSGKSTPEAIEQLRWDYQPLIHTPVEPEMDEIHQFDDVAGQYHQIKEIDQSRPILMFSMYKPGTDQRIDLVMPEGAKIYHKYVNVVLSAATAEESRYRVYCFGFGKPDGKGFFNYIMPDDTIVQADTPDLNLTAWGLVK